MYPVFTTADGLLPRQIRSILSEAHDKWVIITLPKPETIRGAKSDYLRFISSELMDTDIRTITNRKYINSFILIPAGIPVANRAQMLGHSVSTNEKNYSFAIQDLTEVDAAIAAFEGNGGNEEIVSPDDVTHCNPEVIPFPNQRKSRKTL